MCVGCLEYRVWCHYCNDSSYRQDYRLYEDIAEADVDGNLKVYHNFVKIHDSFTPGSR